MKINKDTNKVNTLEINPILLIYKPEFFINEFKLDIVIVPITGITIKLDNNILRKDIIQQQKRTKTTYDRHCMVNMKNFYFYFTIFYLNKI